MNTQVSTHSERERAPAARTLDAQTHSNFFQHTYVRKRERERSLFLSPFFVVCLASVAALETDIRQSLFSPRARRFCPACEKPWDEQDELVQCSGTCRSPGLFFSNKARKKNQAASGERRENSFGELSRGVSVCTKIQVAFNDRACRLWSHARCEGRTSESIYNSVGV